MEAPAAAKSENMLIACRNKQLMTTGNTASARQPCYPEMLSVALFYKGVRFSYKRLRCCLIRLRGALL
jgi:hypothetical protein